MIAKHSVSSGPVASLSFGLERISEQSMEQKICLRKVGFSSTTRTVWMAGNFLRKALMCSPVPNPAMA